MGIFDKLRKKNNALTIQEIISKEYKQEYLDECKYIWKNYVPKAGQADNLQGELIREIEGLRCEAQDNGNYNWDEIIHIFAILSVKVYRNRLFFQRKRNKKYS